MTRSEAAFEIALIEKSFARNEDQRIAAVTSGDAKLEAQCVAYRDELNAKFAAFDAIVNPSVKYED